MKKTLPILIAIQTMSVSILFSQAQTQPKPASDACPNWNSKPVADKADYFAYLSKRPKKQTTTDFSTPKYHNFNAVPVSTSQKRETQVTGGGNTEIKQTNTPGIIYKKSPQTEIPADIAPERTSPSPVIAEQKQASAPMTAETKKENKEEIPVVKENGKSDSDKKEDKHTDTAKKAKKKNSEKHRIKKISFRRKSAAKCPNF